MIFRSTIFVTLIGVASAGITPELHVGVTSRDARDFAGAFEPSVKWSTEGTVGDCDYEGGVNMRADGLATGDVPFSVWGSLRKDVGGWNVKAKVDTRSTNMQHLDVKLQAEGGPADTTLRAKGSVDMNGKSQGGELREVGLTQTFDAPGGDLSISPNYNLASGRPDVNASYAMEDTTISIQADQDRQRITVAQKLDADNQIAPSITSDGDVDIEYRRVVGEGVVTANYKPNESTRLKYEEGPWVAQADIPMDGFYNLNGADTKLAIRRSVTVDAI